MGQSVYGKEFIRHNRRVFPNRGGAGGIVLVELNDMASCHVPYSYLANVLSQDSDAEIWAYNPRPLNSWPQRLLFRLRAWLGSGHFGIYASFGVVRFVAIHPDVAQRRRAGEVVREVLPRLVSKSDLEDLHINGVWVGDLIYDTYLRRFSRPTVDLYNPEFIAFFRESVELFVYWQDFFKQKKIRGLNVSHCVYNLAMPLRIAVQQGVPSFQANSTHLYRLRPDNYFAFNDFHYFPERFEKLPSNVRQWGLAEARRRIERRFAGEVGVDMSYSTKSAYGNARHGRLLKESSRKKVLIATHCFFDSPHTYGKNVFPDFYEWLSFLGEISEKTDYDWYIKTHPDYLPGTRQIIEDFIRRFPRFSLLPSDASHLQIIAEGIDVALTVYGTIGFEYAALGIPVVNNSPNNPHIAYRFNIHTCSVDEYRRVLMNLDSLHLYINKDEVFQYYFMRHVFNTNNLFFDHFDLMLKKLGGYRQQFSPPVYGEWLAEWSPAKHDKIISGLRAFVTSGDFRMDYTHYGCEFGILSDSES